jgi:CxxC motif-containing protein
MRQPLVCIQCPLGCFLEVEHDGRRILQVSGNRCKKGLEYAEREVFHPHRIVTTTVRLAGADLPLLPVRTSQAVPRDLCLRVVREASRLTVAAPVRAGQVIVANVLGSGADLVATRTVPGCPAARAGDGGDAPAEAAGERPARKKRRPSAPARRFARRRR